MLKKERTQIPAIIKPAHESHRGMSLVKKDGTETPASNNPSVTV